MIVCLCCAVLAVTYHWADPPSEESHWVYKFHVMWINFEWELVRRPSPSKDGMGDGKYSVLPTFQ
jgi:hypothetical protein